MKIKNSSKSGFTLIELIIVIAILGILAAIAIPKFNDYRKYAKVGKIIGDCEAIDMASRLYYADTGEWPPVVNNGNTNQQGLTGEGNNSAYKLDGWNGPYLDAWPINPFNENSTGSIETGGNSQKEYQLDYREGIFCIEVTLLSYDKELVEYMDEKIDDTDGGRAGSFRYTSGNRWVYYTIEANH